MMGLLWSNKITKEEITKCLSGVILVKIYKYHGISTHSLFASFLLFSSLVGVWYGKKLGTVGK
jgi:hypothetical protein